MACIAALLDHGCVFFAICHLELDLSNFAHVGKSKLFLEVGQEKEGLHKRVKVARIANIFQAHRNVLEPESLITWNRFSFKAFLHGVHDLVVELMLGVLRLLLCRRPVS